MRKIYLLFTALTVVFSQGCKKLDKPEKMASYLYIPGITLQVQPFEGSSSNEILDAWVYVNDQPVGVLGLPCLVPVLAEGNQKVTVYAGIRDNGIGEARNKYTFYQPFQTNVHLTPGKVDTLKGASAPVVTYYPNSDIDIWYENFDNASIDFVAETNSDAGVTFVADGSFEGPGVGLISLPVGSSFARVHTAQVFTLPKGGKPVYVELNYKTNNSMAIGVQPILGGDVTNLDNTVLKSTDGAWKKMYVNLTEVVSTQSNATDFRFIITINKDNSSAAVENYIDNFKVVYAK